MNIKKDLASNWFKLLQNAICDDIVKLEKNKLKFKSTTWKRNKDKDEGGGEYRIIKDGKIFEKVGVNFSKVHGKFPIQFQNKIPGASKDPRFWASGISVVMHMKNPNIPAMHFNTRYICTTQNWFGGGRVYVLGHICIVFIFFILYYPRFIVENRYVRSGFTIRQAIADRSIQI